MGYFPSVARIFSTREGTLFVPEYQYYMKLEDADMAQNLQVGPKLGNIKKVLFLLFILLFILLY